MTITIVITWPRGTRAEGTKTWGTRSLTVLVWWSSRITHFHLICTPCHYTNTNTIGNAVYYMYVYTLSLYKHFDSQKHSLLHLCRHVVIVKTLLQSETRHSAIIHSLLQSQTRPWKKAWMLNAFEGWSSYQDHRMWYLLDRNLHHLEEKGEHWASFWAVIQ